VVVGLHENLTMRSEKEVRKFEYFCSESLYLEVLHVQFCVGAVLAASKAVVC